MNVLVTGGAGFIGSTLVDRLLAMGHQVAVVDDLSAGSLSNLSDARRDAAGSLKLHQCDVRDPGLVGIIERRRPEVVYHLATCTDRDADTTAAERAAVDLVGTVQVLEGVRSARVRKLVVAGSARAAVGTSTAAISRELAVELAMRSREPSGMETTVVDLPTVFGPRQRPGRESSVVACFAERLVRGLPCVIHGTGEQTRDLLYVDDAVDALVKAATAGDGLRIAVGTGAQTSIRSLHRAMAAVLGSDIDAVPGAVRADEPGSVVVDRSRAAIYLRWEPFTPLAEGLTDTLVSATPGDGRAART